MPQHTSSYIQKKKFFDKILTIYGRNVVLEALGDMNVKVYRLHLSSSNRPSSQISKMIQLANDRGIEIITHAKNELSRISKNSKQDQGVALDIQASNFISLKELIQGYDSYRVIAIDGVTNPQNLGMIIRSAAAGNIDAILISLKSTATISPLVIKASAGTLFKIPIIKSRDIAKDIFRMQQSAHTIVYTLDSHSSVCYRDVEYAKRSLFVLGSESTGVSDHIKRLSDYSISIPMNRGVESLNVAATSTILSFI